MILGPKKAKFDILDKINLKFKMREKFRPIDKVYAFDTRGFHERRQDPVYQAEEILRNKEMLEEWQALDKIKMGLVKQMFLALFDIASLNETDHSRISYDSDARKYLFDESGLLRPNYMRKRIEKFNKKLS